jgi:hypothetical protein
LAGHYGSGLPADTGDADPNLLLAQYGADVLNRVNLDRGRVRPSYALDASAGVDVYHRGNDSAWLIVGVANITNQLNVINFASVFSGAAIAPPRSVTARMRFSF